MTVYHDLYKEILIMNIKISIYENEKIIREININENSSCIENSEPEHKMTPEELEQDRKDYWWFL